MRESLCARSGWYFVTYRGFFPRQLAGGFRDDREEISIEAQPLFDARPVRRESGQLGWHVVRLIIQAYGRQMLAFVIDSVLTGATFGGLDAALSQIKARME